MLRRALEIAPDYIGAWLTLGTLLMERHKTMDAIDAFTKATELEPKNAETWSGLGNAYARGMYAEKAVAAFKRSIQLNPNVPRVHSALGYELKTLGDQDSGAAGISNRDQSEAGVWRGLLDDGEPQDLQV